MILRFENLGADTAVDWIGRALPVAISAELTGSPDLSVISPDRRYAMDKTLGPRPPGAPGVSAELPAALATGATRVGYGTYRVAHGRLEASLTLAEPLSGRVLAEVHAEAPQNDPLAAAAAIARQLTTHLSTAPTRSGEALEAYSVATESPTPAEAAAAASQAIAADPNFAPAYRLLAQAQVQMHDSPAAAATLDRALALGPTIGPLNRARLNLDRAELSEDPAARAEALETLAKLDPRDSVNWSALGELTYNRHDYRRAAQAFRKALEVAPGDASTLNQLGYAAAYLGDPEGAVDALRRYQAQRPADPNALDSLGDVNLIAGRLHQAEDFYIQAAKKDPNFLNHGDLFKAAMARLMEGDLEGAGQYAHQYCAARATARDPEAPFCEGEWLWTSGHPKTGFAALEAAARAAQTGPLRPQASRAYVRLTVWSLLEGDRAAASIMAAQAVATAGPATAPLAQIAQFLTQPPAPAAEWAARAARLAPGPRQQSIRDFALAYALLLSHDFPAAGEVFQRIYDNAEADADEGIPVLLAWCHLETGRTDEAAALLRWNPIPPPNGLAPLGAFYFPKLFDLRAKLAEKQGRADDARTNAELHRKLSGQQ